MVHNLPKEPVVDPGFPRRGAQTPEMGMEAKTCYLARFLRKGMKMKEIGPGDLSLAAMETNEKCKWGMHWVPNKKLEKV